MLHTGAVNSPEGDPHRKCPECKAAFLPLRMNQLFCSDTHRIAWHNRDTTRGRRSTSLLVAARVTRNGSRPGSSVFMPRAGRDADRLIRQWLAEDLAAGRMSCEDYIAARYRAGIEP